MPNVWDEFEKTTEVTEKKGAFNRIDFKEAETTIRLLSSDGVKRMYHFVPSGPKGSGKPVICCGEGCPVCASGNEANPKWLFPALDRTTLNVGIAQLPLTVMRGINRLRKMAIFGPDIKSYDIIVIKDVSPGKDGKMRTQYQVQGMPKQMTPKLDADVKARIKEELSKIDLEQVAKPYSPEQTMRYLGWSTGPTSTQQIPNTSKLNAPAQVQASSPKADATKTNVDISKFLAKPEPEADDSFDGSAVEATDGEAVDFSDDALEL